MLNECPRKNITMCREYFMYVTRMMSFNLNDKQNIDTYFK